MIVGGIVAACVQAWAVGSSKRSRLDRCHTHAMRMDDFVPSVLVAMAGAIVMLLGANWPDLVLALLVAGWCGLLASKTMRDAKRMRAPNRAV